MRRSSRQSFQPRRTGRRCLLLVSFAALAATSCTLVAADCGWGASVVAWVDEDRDGARDPAELPLEGVRFQVNDTLNQYSDVGERAVTDWNGSAQLHVGLPGCPDARFEIVSEPPPGYASLMSEPVEITGPGYGDQAPLAFAYERLPGIASPTPHVPRLACDTYHLGASEFDTSQAGDVWAVTSDGAAKYDPATDSWDAFPVHGSDLGLFERIEVAPTGQAVIRAYNGVAALSDHNWTLAPLDPDISFGLAPAIGTSQNGDIWFYVPAPPDMLASFRPHTGEWTYFGPDHRSADVNLYVLLVEHFGLQYAFFGSTKGDGFEKAQPPAGWSVTDRHRFSDSEFREAPLRGWIQDAALCPDGALWISHSFGVSSLDPISQEWRFYDPSESLGFLPHIGSIACAPTGQIWVAAIEAHPILIRLDPPTQAGVSPRWTTYDPRDGIPDDEWLQDILADSDGTVWIGYGSHDMTAKCSLR